MALLEHCLREDLNRRARRVMGVLKPVKLVIENYPENAVETIDFPYHPENPAMGSRPVPFSRELFVERDDFCEEAPKKWYRLAPGAEVRLRHAYYVTCTGFDKDPQTGEIAAIRCVHDPATKGGWSTDGRRCAGPCTGSRPPHAVPAEVRSTTACSPRVAGRGAGGLQDLPQSPLPGDRVHGHARTQPWPRPKPSRSSSSNVWATFAWTAIPPPPRPSSNRSVALKDSWAKVAKK
jgi:glutaminyl-tRNA synthetase